jgi:hypothetical protein
VRAPELPQGTGSGWNRSRNNFLCHDLAIAKRWVMSKGRCSLEYSLPSLCGKAAPILFHCLPDIPLRGRPHIRRDAQALSD